MQDWIHRYPGVQALLQQPGEVLDGVSLEDEDARARVCRAGSESFLHVVETEVLLARVLAGNYRDGNPSLCETPRPAPVCACGAYRLTWEW